uniref:RT07557p n=2 Tax=Drosophila melanogaster TaxID=7227 RepID=D5SHJ3_DROME|nr:RT07557p [Drosophila melanogaster]
MNFTSYFLGLVFLLTVYLDLTNSFVAFTASSTHGIFAAIAVPLELPHRNVFVSYNFEANYNLPANWEKWTIFQNGPIESEEVVDETDTETDRKLAAGCQNCTVKEENEAGSEEVEEITEVLPQERKVRSLLTRSNIYRIFVDKLKRSGFRGESCLLRLICETSAAQLDEFNGVLGSLMHVLFSPSSSESEDLPLRYYQAEHDGWNGHCHVYEPGCGESILELISEPFEDIFKHIERNKIIKYS